MHRNGLALQMKQGRLSAQQLASYRDDGYLILDPLFSRQEIDALKARVARRYASKAAGSFGDSGHDDNPHLEDPSYFKYVMDARVLEVVTQVLGPDVALLSTHLMSRMVRAQGEPWHFDARKIEAHVAPAEVMGVLVALEPFTASFGGLSVVPGTHRDTPNLKSEDGKVPHLIPPGMFDPSQVVPLEMEVGQVVLLNPWVIHGSQNRDETFIMRFTPTSARCTQDFPKDQPLYRVHGRDLSGGHNVYAPIPEHRRLELVR